MENFEKIYGKGNPNEAFSQYFNGESFLNPLADFEYDLLRIANATFEHGCRTTAVPCVETSDVIIIYNFSLHFFCNLFYNIAFLKYYFCYKLSF